MRVVFDSNVWIAALAASGACKDVVEDALDSCEVFISPYILGEIDRVLDKKIGATGEERAQARRWLQDVCQGMQPPVRKDIACPDPDDLPILWLALAVHADLLVTGDQALLRLKEIQGIRIIPPALFWNASK